MEAYARTLLTRGYSVVPLPEACRIKLRRASKRLLGERLPEKRSLGISSSPGILPGEPRAAPGFGGCPFPSSMHCREARDFLAALNDEVFVPLALSLAGNEPVRAFVGEDPYEAPCIDRWCQRDAGQAPGNESPHRDISPDTLGTHRDVLMFGGFANANTADGEDQFFTCSPGTHVVGTVRDQGSGFAQIPKEHRGDFDFETVHYISRKRDSLRLHYDVAYGIQPADCQEEGTLRLWQTGNFSARRRLACVTKAQPRAPRSAA